MGLVSRHYWVEDGESGDNAAQNIDHTVASGERPRLRYLYVSVEPEQAIQWTLERPSGTVVLQGHGPDFIDFGPEGFDVPGSAGEDLRLAIEAGGSAGDISRGWIVGVDVTQE